MPELPREIYEQVLAHPMEMDEYLKQELTLSYVDLDGSHDLKLSTVKPAMVTS